MIKISDKKAIELHTLMVNSTGGLDGVRDFGLLNSALEGAFATFGGVDLYPTIEEKAAKIGCSIVLNHAFIDGNKRIGIFVMLIFLKINGIIINAEDEEIIYIGLKLAQSEIKYDDLLKWIINHEKS